MSPVKKSRSIFEILSGQQWEAAAKGCLLSAIPANGIESGRKWQAEDGALQNMWKGELRWFPKLFHLNNSFYTKEI